MSKHLVSPFFCAASSGGNFHREILLIRFYMLLISFVFLNDMEMLPNEGSASQYSGSTEFVQTKEEAYDKF